MILRLTLFRVTTLKEFMKIITIDFTASTSRIIILHLLIV